MSILNGIPSWLGTGIVYVITLVLGSGLGYVIRLRIERHQKRTEAEETQLQRLEHLAGLLTDSGDVFRDQNTRVKQLWNIVYQKVPENVRARGYDATFRYMYDKYTDDERDLHELIRNLTVGRLYYLDKQMQDWLDVGYRFLSAPDVPADLAKNDELNEKKPCEKREKELRKNLDILRRHLTLWLAQYNRDIIEHPNPAHTLVYANDERGQGVQFPTGIEQVLDDVIVCWRKRMKS